MPSRRDLLRCAVVGVAVTTALGAGALAWSSTLLGEYSVMDMGGGHGGGGGHEHGGHAEHGAGGPGASAASGTTGSTGTVSVTALTADPDRPADVRVELVARQETIDVPGGRRIDGYTVNGTSPGPEIRATQGDLVEVDVRERIGRGRARRCTGTASTCRTPPTASRASRRTRFPSAAGTSTGSRLRMPAPTGTTRTRCRTNRSWADCSAPSSSNPPSRPAIPADVDVTALLHVYGGQHTLNGRVEDEHVAAEPGSTVRVRVINSDQGTAAVWSDAPYRVLAVDGHDVNGPTDVRDRRLLIPAGGRADVAVQAPPRGAVRLHVGGARSILVGDPAASAPAARQPSETLDLLAYGDPAPLGLDPSSPDRSFDYVIARRFGLIDGRPGNFWTINGRMFPDVPMFHVSEGDVVVMRIVNDSGDVHPMHLHGHHVVVLSRDGVAASGSPWWVDSLDVHPGESYEIAFVADNPGIWSDHCHTLPHAVDGLVAHVMYDGVTTPFTINGDAGNRPE